MEAAAQPAEAGKGDGVKAKGKLSPRSVGMEFKGGLEEEVTAHAGVVLLVETGRRGGVG